ncbi:2-octaprenyl-6-methoxyphenyl hydroxylase [Endozoicomonas sp. GU-1]|uniref:2-octaprenyl-6-methoxyphenyl hydroxylase n=1 Tax=Endozoicomonas sp. GU-1 TaxID=3009078 RepID=UPI0022B35EAA|nr:2-octaprenyl-6-methoxyphenyl hydroxylase [Endozoicomonas sp. GU-1]WBA82562.1 2-octaprenyl-6-methoxyphenyl hydroxylase [Endozoicomonas sp. GU-1]WBA85492.1 2-octaprenyl-6-methoxyphenyl hydroxylase [Endozoicomonas sp. GU-1]
MNNSTDKMDFDVLVIGAGLVGASLVCALEQVVIKQGLRLAMVETHDLSQPRDIPPSFDARASALSWGTCCIYQQLGLWPDLVDQAQAITDVHVSDRGSFGVSRLRASDEGVPALGYVVKNHVLGDVLLQRLKGFQKQGRVTMFSPDRVASLSPVPGGMKVQLRHSEISASLVVLADGGRSGLMDQLGIGLRQCDYHQQGIIANIALDRPHNGMAWERFAGQGPMALLPLTGDHHFAHRAGLVWTLPDEEADSLYALADDDFLALLQQRFGYRAGRFIAVGKRDRYPLTMRIAKEQVRPGLVILGNAAHAIHPVAGQGYNLSIRDTVALAGNISDSLERQIPVGDLGRLQEYWQQQLSDQSLTSQFCDGLVRLFSRTDTASVLSRNLGLVALDYCHPVKSTFTRRAMGL